MVSISFSNCSVRKKLYQKGKKPKQRNTFPTMTESLKDPNQNQQNGSIPNLQHRHSQSFSSEELQDSVIGELIDFMDSVDDGQDEHKHMYSLKPKLTVSRSVPRPQRSRSSANSKGIPQIPRTKLKPQTSNTPTTFISAAKSTPETFNIHKPTPIAIPPSKTSELPLSSLAPRSYG